MTEDYKSSQLQSNYLFPFNNENLKLVKRFICPLTK